MPPAQRYEEPPVIPNQLFPLKICHYRVSRQAWRHVSQHKQERKHGSTSGSSSSGTWATSSDRAGSMTETTTATSASITDTATSATNTTATSATTATNSDGSLSGSHALPSSMRVVTWNIDFMTRSPRTRIIAAIRHIQTEVLKCKEPMEAPPLGPCCIMLQEVHVDALSVLLADAWVRAHFIAVPISPTKFPSEQYGNVTLVYGVTVVEASLVSFGSSCQGRNGVMVDVIMGRKAGSGSSGSGSEGGQQQREVRLRLINTHLESLPVGETGRMIQLPVLASFLQPPEVDGGIIVGDMNSICEGDKGLVAATGLRDAWTKGDGDESGFTWGFQGQNSGGFPAARLDKMLFTPRVGIKLDPPKRIGIGAKVGNDLWISDHYGLTTKLRVL